MVNTRRSEQRWTEVVDGPYRYHLTRDFGEGEAGSMAFVMLNPSTADHLLNDDTVQRCSELAVARGCRTLEVGNLYALRATNPRDLNNEEDPKGPLLHAHCGLRTASGTSSVPACPRSSG